MNRMRGDNTRYGLPPDAPLVRPIEPPWDVHLHLLVGLWLEGHCTCGRRLFPLKLMAAEVGWTATLRHVVPRLRCRTCAERPDRLLLLDDPSTGAPGRIGGGPRWELPLGRLS